MRSVQKQLKVKFRDNKKGYRRKLDNKLHLNNILDVLLGIKTLKGSPSAHRQMEI